MLNHSYCRQFFCALLFLCTALSCAVNPVTGKKQLILLSEGQEKAMGLQSDPEVIASYGAYPDQKLQDFINQKGKEMAAISQYRVDLSILRGVLWRILTTKRNLQVY